VARLAACDSMCGCVHVSESEGFGSGRRIVLHQLSIELEDRGKMERWRRHACGVRSRDERYVGCGEKCI
jgi:hypothetical protein